MLRNASGWSRWLLRDPDPGSRALLFALPHPGCGAETYRRWPRTVGRWEVCPVQLPGRDVFARRSRPACFQQLAAELAGALGQYCGRSLGFFGHGAVALLGYETAVRMAGREPVQVFVSAQPAPGCGPDRFDRASDALLAEVLFRVLLEVGGNPLPSLVEARVGVFRDDLAAAAAYRPVAASDRARVTAVGWADDAVSSVCGWHEFGGVAAHVLPGDQFRFLSAPVALQRVLDPAQ
ncbi:Surfactin synthase thioesterase subunit [Saccharopolyspora kobensis]|uniref:Surfactin synthase thioesterase subunit n=1 Tax=Saccharopolyspora kobensis TaxID=146035 RepID=A0A1H6DT16_9PSEU|nr:thioesterase domain-containing protein [Saccharopolyspora kobensis]SEG88174.1 Surfactin synthase thioesterase subunit [Saccharopolyspora kobensis]SFE02694.1 Surfactin synthase thioesterase subunit [Saccharopolyspora kobensis]